MDNKTKHLYIHIPFCSRICTYCDFVRIVSNDNVKQKQYLDLVLNVLKQESSFKQFSTIYLGGGTPNHLSDDNLDYLLINLKKYLDDNSEYEFCLELNPEDVTLSQVQILSKNKINRVSLGVQTTNDLINKLLHRNHNLNDVKNAINLLKSVGINNISCDFIYNLPYLKTKDLDDAFNFIIANDIKHVSFYSLEIKEGSILYKEKYHLNIDRENEQYVYINNKLKSLGFIRYEVASYAKQEKYFSKHNLSYWNNEDWKAIGSGAYGFENNEYYCYKNNINQLIKVNSNYNKKDLYQHLLIMGLRSIFGLDLKVKRNNDAYLYFYDQIKDDVYLDKDQHLHIKNIDFLDACLIKII